jgi:flagellar motor switch protein FliM
MALEINPSIAFPVIDKILGGNANDNYIPERDMTSIEWRLTGHVVNETLKFLKESWRPIMEIDFRVSATDTNPMLMQIVPPNEVVILLCFEIKMGANTGMLNICVPFPVIEPKIHEFSTIQTWFQNRRSSDTAYEASKLQEGIKDAQMEIIAYVAKTSMTLEQLLHLKPGDLLLTRKDVTDPLLIKLSGKPKYWAYAGQNRKFKAIRIEKEAHEDDAL